MLEEIIKERRRKLDELKKAGHNPYPSLSKRNTLVSQALKNFAALEKQKKQIVIAGRVVGLRDQGNIIFSDIYDESGKIQTLLKKDALADFKLLKASIDIGDFLEVAGVLAKTKAGEKSVEATKAKIIVKSLRPLPSEWYGLKNTEERYRRRYLDTLLNPEVKKRFEKRSEIIKEIRNFLEKEGFLEVETPVLQPIPGGAVARPFVTRHNALNQDFYLRIAPELYLKRLLVGGFEKIFEIGRNFRNEGIDRDHNPEFTMLELYWAYRNYRELMKFAEKLLKKFIPGKYEEITFAEIFRRHSGKNFSKVSEKELEDIFKKEVRPKITKPTFVTDYPENIMPLAKFKEDSPKLTESFQFIVNGAEIIKGFSEMNDPLAQREQMEKQEKEFRSGDQEMSRLDEDFLEALEYGMPPAAGLGLGIDRLVALATKSPGIKETIIFPTLRTKE